MSTDGASSGSERGKIAAVLHGARVAFPELRYTYPLKLLAPHAPGAPGAAIVYMLSYGGGLVSGDQIRLDVDIGPGVKLLLLSQGSTKVFKARPGTRAAAAATAGRETRQRLRARVAAGGLLLLLPDPVTCFAGAAYAQLQTARLERGGSAVLCDWYTAGRGAPPRGERWAFARYGSVNEVWVDGARAVRDATVLEGAGLPARMGPYGCYAVVLLAGPLVEGVCGALEERFGAERVFGVRSPPELLWSISAVGGVRVLRVAGAETEGVREWLRAALAGLGALVGAEAYSKAFV